MVLGKNFSMDSAWGYVILFVCLGLGFGFTTCLYLYLRHEYQEGAESGNQPDVTNLYSSSYKWGKHSSLTSRIQAGCLFALILYPTVVIGFTLIWRLPNFMILFAENYHVLVQRKQQRKMRKHLQIAHATSHLSDLMDKSSDSSDRYSLRQFTILFRFNNHFLSTNFIFNPFCKKI